MATKKNFKSVSKKVLNSLYSAICWLGHGLKVTGQVIIYAVVAFFYGLITLLIYNPVIVFFLALICPRKISRGLYGLQSDTCFAFWGEVLLVLNSPVIAILPWYAKKAFLWESGLAGCSVKKQVRFFREADDEGKAEIVKKQWLDNEAKDILWRDQDNHLLLVDKMLNLSDEQFKELIDKGEIDVLKAYMLKYTLSDNKIFSLVSFVATRFSSSPRVGFEAYWNLLKTSIQRNGLSAQMVSKIYSRCPNLKDAVSNELSIFAQRQIIGDTQNYDSCSDGWKKFCKKAEGIFEEAQILMNVWQYDVFHDAGMKLSENAIVYLLSKGDLTMAERIFKYEDKNGILSDEIEALVAANPRLTKLFLAVA